MPGAGLDLHEHRCGAPPVFDPLVLMAKGSLYLTRPSLGHYIATREGLLARARAVFDWIARGEIAVRVARTYALADAAEAHRDLEGRRLTGKGLLLP